MLSGLVTALALVSSAVSHGDHEHQTLVSGPHKSLWYNTMPGDGETQVGDSFRLQ
jgi:agmatinase